MIPAIIIASTSHHIFLSYFWTETIKNRFTILLLFVRVTWDKLGLKLRWVWGTIKIVFPDVISLWNHFFNTLCTGFFSCMYTAVGWPIKTAVDRLNTGYMKQYYLWNENKDDNDNCVTKDPDTMCMYVKYIYLRRAVESIPPTSRAFFFLDAFFYFAS